MLYNYKGVVFKIVIWRYMREEGCQKIDIFALYKLVVQHVTIDFIETLILDKLV